METLGAALLLLTVLVLVGCGAANRDEQLNSRLHQALSQAEVGDQVDLSPVLGDGWDSTILFEGEPDAEAAREALGFEWRDYQGGDGEGTTIVFVNDDQVVRWAYLPYVTGGATGEQVQVVFPTGESWLSMRPADTVFEVSRRLRGGPIEICLDTCEQ
jgi:hypothetical protein